MPEPSTTLAPYRREGASRCVPAPPSTGAALDPYAALGLPPDTLDSLLTAGRDTDAAALRAARLRAVWLELAGVLHPDSGASPRWCALLLPRGDAFAAVGAAYSLLLDLPRCVEYVSAAGGGGGQDDALGEVSVGRQ